MSSFNCPVVKIQKIIEHGDANSLEVAQILGYSCVVRKGEYTEGELAVFIPPDSVVDTFRPEFSFLKKDARADGKFKVKTVKLRGVVSQGILLKLPIAQVLGEEGQDFKEYFGVEKYDPPEIGSFKGGNSLGLIPAHLGGKYDIEKFQNYPHIFYAQDYGEFVATEKLEGTNGLAYIKEDHFGVCSHSFEKKDDGNIWWEVAYKYDLMNKLKEIFEIWKTTKKMVAGTFEPSIDIAIRFEVIGPGIQKNIYKLGEREIRVFDFQVLGGYLGYNAMRAYCMLTGLPQVPEIYKGPILPLGNMRDFACGTSLLYNTEREGLVWKPLIESTHPRMGRVILKVISWKYDMKRADPR